MKTGWLKAVILAAVLALPVGAAPFISPSISEAQFSFGTVTCPPPSGAAPVQGGGNPHKHGAAITVLCPTPVPTPTSTPTPTPRPTPTPTPPPTCPANLQTALNAVASGGTLDLTGCAAYPETHITIPSHVTLAHATVNYNGGVGGSQTGMIDLSAGSKLNFVTATGNGLAYSVVRAWLAGSAGSLIENSDISGGAVLGVIGYQTNGTTVQTSNIHGNNAANTANCGNECGGIKIGDSSGVVINGNSLDNNVGPGVWADVSDSSWTIENNKAWSNTGAGIMYEISTGGSITGNALWENGWGYHNANLDNSQKEWNANILISSSGTVTVTGNTAAWAQSDISFTSQNRGGPTTQGDSATGNTLASSTGDPDSWVQTFAFEDWSDTFYPWTMVPGAQATCTQLTAAGIPCSPQTGH